MKNLSRVLLAAAAAGLIAPAVRASAAKVTSDLAAPQKRQETVEKAQRLTRPPVPATVRPGLPHPFNPANFDQPDDPPAGGASRPAGGAAAAPSAPVGNRDLLEAMAARIQPTGYFKLGGNPLLTFPGAKRVRIGDIISVQYNEREYDIEIVAIDSTSFTLRYRGEEITRPIAKNTK